MLVDYSELQELFTYGVVGARREAVPLDQHLAALAADAGQKGNHKLACQYDLLRVLYKGCDYSAVAVRARLWQLWQHHAEPVYHAG